MVLRTATYLKELVDSLEVMARVQLARRNLKGEFIDLTKSSGCSGNTRMIDFTDEELIRDNRNTQTKLSNSMQKFVLALKKVE